MVIFLSTTKYHDAKITSYFWNYGIICETAQSDDSIHKKLKTLLHELHKVWRVKPKNLVFGEPPPLVEDSKNIWVGQFQHAYRAFWVNNQQI